MVQVDKEHLDHFAVKITGDPVEYPLNGWELGHNDGIMGDDDQGIFLTVLRWDDNESRYAKKGTDLRWTKVVPEKEGVQVGDVLYEFPGLIRNADIRAWYRAKMGLD